MGKFDQAMMRQVVQPFAAEMEPRKRKHIRLRPGPKDEDLALFLPKPAQLFKAPQLQQLMPQNQSSVLLPAQFRSHIYLALVRDASVTSLLITTSFQDVCYMPNLVTLDVTDEDDPKEAIVRQCQCVVVGTPCVDFADGQSAGYLAQRKSCIEDGSHISGSTWRAAERTAVAVGAKTTIYEQVPSDLHY